MTSAWRVPDSYRQHAYEWDGWPAWLPGLGRTAAACADAWGVAPDGPPMHGWVSMVWPVRDAAGTAYVLKLSPPVPETAAEAISLSTWAAAGREPQRMISPAQVDLERRALLLPRLDPTRSLEHHPDVDEAVTELGLIVASVAGIPAPAGVPLLLDQLAELAERIEEESTVLPRQVQRARATIAELATLLSSPDTTVTLLHNDCHFSNVLRDPRPGGPDWLGIDPLPIAGITEWELTPMLRNRWPAAVATGDPDRALRRRVDQVAEIVELDRELVRSCAQLAAVFNLVGLLPERTDHMFYGPYSVMATW